MDRASFRDPFTRLRFGGVGHPDRTRLLHLFIHRNAGTPQARFRTVRSRLHDREEHGDVGGGFAGARRLLDLASFPDPFIRLRLGGVGHPHCTRLLHLFIHRNAGRPHAGFRPIRSRLHNREQRGDLGDCFAKARRRLNCDRFAHQYIRPPNRLHNRARQGDFNCSGCLATAYCPLNRAHFEDPLTRPSGGRSRSGFYLIRNELPIRTGRLNRNHFSHPFIYRNIVRPQARFQATRNRRPNRAGHGDLCTSPARAHCHLNRIGFEDPYVRRSDGRRDP